VVKPQLVAEYAISPAESISATRLLKEPQASLWKQAISQALNYPTRLLFWFYELSLWLSHCRRGQAGSADMGHQDTGMGMIGIISRGGIETTMIDITNPGDTHENITRPSGTSVPRIQRWSLTEFPRAWAEAIE
jgi:hypothetical protein